MIHYFRTDCEEVQRSQSGKKENTKDVFLFIIEQSSKTNIITRWL